MDMVPFYLNASISFTAIPMNDTEATPQRLKEGVQHLKEWLAKQPHLPNVDDEEWLATFLCQCKLSLEKAKSKLDGYFSYRNKYPQLLKNRNPFSPEVHNFFEFSKEIIWLDAHKKPRITILTMQLRKRLAWLAIFIKSPLLVYIIKRE